MLLPEFRKQLTSWVDSPAWVDQLPRVQDALKEALVPYGISGTPWEAEGPAQVMQTQYPTQLVQQWVRWLALDGELTDLRIRMHLQLTWPKHVIPGPANALLMLTLQAWPDTTMKFFPVLSGVINWENLSETDGTAAVLDWLSPADLDKQMQVLAIALNEEFRP